MADNTIVNTANAAFEQVMALFEIAQSRLQEYNNILSQLIGKGNTIKEIERQYAEKLAEKDAYNAGILQDQLNQLYKENTGLGNQRDAAGAAYQAAIKAYNEARATLLTPAEQAQASQIVQNAVEVTNQQATQAATIANQTANSAATQKMTDEQRAELMKWIYIGVGIVAVISLIGFSIYAYKKWFKKSETK